MDHAPRRLALPALALTALALALAACGDDETTTQAQTTAPAGSSTTTSTSSTADATATEDATGGGAETGTGDSGDGGESVPPEATDPEAAATAFLVSRDTDLVCGELIAPPAFAKTYGTVAGCRAGRPPASLARGVEAEGLAVAPDERSATVTLVPEGGVYDGVPVDFELSGDGTRWVIASVKADVPVGP